MTDIEQGTAATPTAVPRRSRDVDYAFAIAANVVILFVLNIWPTWHAIPYLTRDVVSVVVIINVAAVAAIALNVVCLIVDRGWMKPLTEFVGAAFALIIAMQLWGTFPFDLPVGAVNWMLIARVAIGFAIVVSSISLVVQFILVIVRAARERSEDAAAAGAGEQ